MDDAHLIIFDCDGTLVDSEPIANRVFVEQVQEFGIPLTDEEAWKHFPGTSLEECMQYVTKTYGFIFPEDFVPSHRERQRVAFAKDIKPIQGVKIALDQIPFAKCVASNGPLPAVRSNLEATGLLAYFDGFFSAHEIERWKPEPDLFLHAAAKLDRMPEQCLVVEDSDAGILAAKRAGMKVLAYQPVHSHYTLSENGTMSFDDMKQLPELVQHLLVK